MDEATYHAKIAELVPAIAKASEGDNPYVTLKLMDEILGVMAERIQGTLQAHNKLEDDDIALLLTQLMFIARHLIIHTLAQAGEG